MSLMLIYAIIIAMEDLLWHPSTKEELSAFAQNPSHALLISGERGSGKLSAARALSAAVLNTDEAKLDSRPYFMHIAPKNGSIKIDTVRTIEKFLLLKVPFESQSINRTILIEDADLMGTEAQNAILKHLEEPPAKTLFILTCADINALLTTIVSRANHIRIRKPSHRALIDYFTRFNYSETQIETSVLMSDRLPGLTKQLMDQSGKHSLTEAVDYAKQLLASEPYERLVIIGKHSKDNQLAVDTLKLIQQMSSIVLSKGIKTKKWQLATEAAYKAETRLINKANPKLVLSSFALSY